MLCPSRFATFFPASTSTLSLTLCPSRWILTHKLDFKRLLAQLLQASLSSCRASASSALQSILARTKANTRETDSRMSCNG